jgi:hypothetical protein
MYDAQDRRFVAVDPVKRWQKEPAATNYYVYCIDNPLKYVDLTGKYYIQLYYDNNLKEFRCKAIKEPILMSGLKITSSTVLFGALQGIVTSAEYRYSLIGGSSIFEDSTADSIIQSIKSAVLEKEITKLSKLGGKLFGWADTIVDVVSSLVPISDIKRIDDVAFKLFEMAGIGLDVKNSIMYDYEYGFIESGILILKSQMAKTYRFINNNLLYFFGIFPNTSKTFWQVDLEINKPAFFESSNDVADKYYSRLLCALIDARNNRLIRPGDEYVYMREEISRYIYSWKNRLADVIQEFKKYIYPESVIKAL